MEGKIRGILSQGHGISDADCTSLQQTIAEAKHGGNKYDTPEKLATTIDRLALEMSKERHSPVKYPITVACAGNGGGKTAATANAFNIYIENSASIDGYMNGNTEFKASLFELMTRINGNHETLTASFINDKPYPINKPLKEFIDFLEPRNMKGVGKRNVSDINDVLRQAIETFKTDHRIAVILSDYIYSIPNKAVEEGLTDQEYKTVTTMQSIKDLDCAVLIIKSTSQFKGTYYDLHNAPHQINQERPYYTWVIGKTAQIADFMERYQTATYKGYKNSIVFYASQNTPQPYYSILSNTDKKGRFQKRDRSQSQVKAITNISPDRDGKSFQFAVAIDCSHLPADPSYYTNPKNYTAVTALKDTLNVVAVRDIVKADRLDKESAGNATHYIILASSKLPHGKQQITLRLAKQLPEWVTASSINDDSNAKNIDDRTTFGIRYLIEGVSKAFDPNGKGNYFSVPLELEY